MKKKEVVMLIILIIGVVALIFINVPKSKKVKVKKEEKITKKEEKKDNIKPEIKLKGREELTIVKNGIYEEMGAVATDNIDGDISKNIKIKNNIDTKKAGNYEVVYTVLDSSKNKNTIKRKVNVIDVTEPNTDGIPVLMYHYFYDDTNGETGEDSNYTSKTDFSNQLKYFKDNNFYFPSMKEISLYVEGTIELPKNSVVITMDDGHADNYTIAYPLAVEYKVPITMFVVTSWTNVKDQLQQEMIDTGYVIMQSHTHDMHRAGCSGIGHGGIIQCIDFNEGINDLKKSKEELGNSDSLAYPFGDNNESAQNMLKEAGFMLGFTTEYGKVKKGMNKLALPRVRVNGGNSLDNFVKSL